jgi:hypothetical protein
MSTSTTETTPVSPAELAEAVLDVLTRKGPALTVSQLRDNLPRRFRLPNAEITRCLEGMVAEGKVHSWPPYRSTSPRFGAQAMEACARATMQRLLGEHAFTPHELIGDVREEVPGLPEDKCKQILDELLASGQVRKLPPRMGSNANLIGHPNPRSYLAPMFEVLFKSLEKLSVRLESEGVPRTRMVEEAKELWQEVIRETEKDLQGAPEAKPETEPEQPSAFQPETAIAGAAPAPAPPETPSPLAEAVAPQEEPAASAPPAEPESPAAQSAATPDVGGPVA